MGADQCFGSDQGLGVDQCFGSGQGLGADQRFGSDQGLSASQRSGLDQRLGADHPSVLGRFGDGPGTGGHSGWNTILQGPFRRRQSRYQDGSRGLAARDTKYLNSKQKQPEGSYKSYYSEVDENDQKEAKIKIKRTLQTDLDLEINTKQEYDAMDPTDNKTKSL